jgi:hypothetical protein
MANGIDPANLGKGDWLVTLSSCISHLKPVWGSSFPSWANTDIEKLMYYEKNTLGMDYVIVKAVDGNYTYPLPSGTLPPSQGGVLPPAQYTSTVVQAAHDAGLKIFPYFYIYGGSSNHKTTTDSTLQGEINIFNSVMSSVGGDGAVFDIEGQYSGATGGPNAAITTYLQGIGRTQNQTVGSRDNLFMAYSTFPYVHLHSEVPYLLLGDYLDAAMPQAYWETIGTSPSSSSSRSPTKGQSLTGTGGPTRMLKDVDSEWGMKSLESTPRNNIWNGHPESIKPIIITGQSYNGATGAEITEFVNAMKTDTTAPYAGGYKSVNWFDADFNTSGQRSAIAANDIGDLPGVAVNVSPASGSSTSTHTNLVFTWTAASKATDYDVILDGVTIGSNISTTSFTYPSRILTGSHSWHVNANNIIGTTVGSNTSFTRSAIFSAGQTIQVFGTGGAGLKTYSTSTGTTAAKVMPDGSIGTIVSGPIVASGFDRWQIQWKGDAQGTTFWSAEDFLQFAPAPGVPSIVSPSDGTVTTAKPALLDWNDVATATSYDVFLDGVKVGNGITASQYSLDSSLTVADHSWQVVAKNSQGSTSGATWIFKVVPLAPTGLTATDNSFSTKVALAWTAAASASGYNIYRSTTNNSATASSIGSTSGTTYDDTTAVAGTTYFYWVKAKNATATEGAFSASDSGVRSTDNVGPAVTDKNFDRETSTHKVVFTFSEALLASSLQADDVSVISRDVANPTPFSPVSVSFDSITNKATFSFSSTLAQGNYRATLSASSVSDTANNTNSAAVDLDFFFMNADANANQSVDINDFNILATNFGKTAKTFSQGNFDYSADGTITITDFNILAANFGKTLAPPQSFAAQSATGSFGQSISTNTSPTAAKDESQTDLLNDAGLI